MFALLLTEVLSNSVSQVTQPSRSELGASLQEGKDKRCK